MPPSTNTPRRVILSSGAGSRTIALGRGGELTIGRSRDCDIHLDDALVSRTHAVLHLGDEVAVEDLGSQNGTQLIRGSLAARSQLTGRAQLDRIAPGARVALEAGDVVQIGTSLLLLAADRSDELEVLPDPDQIVLADPKMRQLAALIERIAPTDISVILLGESGAGKEVFAHRIHDQSARGGPFVGLNCAALPEQLLESELFGHEKGAFTGATGAKPGLLEAAAGGTVFLDEIGELALPLQAKLLRVLEERSVRRLGALRAISIDVRIVSATNRELEHEVAAGRFRRDLYYRLNGVSVVIPPLRERPSEIVPLARLFCRQLSASRGRPAPRLTAEAERALLDHSWPGNIRELRSVIELSLALCSADQLDAERLLISRRIELGGGLAAEPPSPDRGAGPGDRLRTAPPAAEPAGPANRAGEVPGEPGRDSILEALDRCAGNQTRAAELLGISRRVLLRRLDRFGIARPRKKR